MRVGLITRHLFTHLGYGSMVRDIIREFIRQGVDVSLFTDGTPVPKPHQSILTQEALAFFRSLMNGDKPDVWLHIVSGCRFGPRERYQGIYSVGFSMFEALHNPPHWAPRVHEVDEVWVPSQFNIQNFQELGLSRDDLHWMPLGINADRYRPKPCEVRPRNRQNTEFKFIAYSVGGYGHRKNFGLLILAFAEVFAGHSDALLILKTSPQDYPRFYSDWEAVRSTISNPPSIVAYVRKLQESEMPSFFNMGDVFAYASGGEGQGLPPLEAMSCAKPVISTDNSAMADYMSQDIAYPVRSIYLGNEPYAFPVMSDLKETLWHVYQNREEAAEKGVKARQYIAQHRSLEVCCRRMLERLREVSN